MLTTRILAGEGVGYEITSGNRTRRSYGFSPGFSSSADKHLASRTLGQLREYCRMHDRQASLFSGILDRALDNIFGSSFDFIPKTGDEGLDKQAKAYIDNRMLAPACDASGVMDFIDMAKLSIRSVWNDGDVLFAKRPDGSMLSFEADQIESPDTRTTGSSRIVQGVELNDLNRPVAYWVRQRKTTSTYGGVDTAVNYKRIAAGNTFMPAYRKRFGQSRGVPYLAAILGTFERFNNYLDFEQFAAEQNSMFGWKIKRKPDDNVLAGNETNTDSSTSDVWDKMQKMTHGLMLELEPDEDVEMFGATRPGDNFSEYVIMCCRLIGVGIGYPLEIMLLDYSKTNYSSGRMGLVEAKRMFKGWQRFAGAKLCLPWYNWQIARGIATGELPAKPELFQVRLQWPAWEMIDKKKEAEGDTIDVKNRVKSRSQCIRERGEVPDEIFDEIAAETKKLKELGIIIDESSEPAKDATQGQIDDTLSDVGE